MTINKPKEPSSPCNSLEIPINTSSFFPFLFSICSGEIVPTPSPYFSPPQWGGLILVRECPIQTIDGIFKKRKVPSPFLWVVTTFSKSESSFRFFPQRHSPSEVSPKNPECLNGYHYWRNECAISLAKIRHLSSVFSLSDDVTLLRL